jgi:hypothetical protein
MPVTNLSFSSSTLPRQWNYGNERNRFAVQNPSVFLPVFLLSLFINPSFTISCSEKHYRKFFHPRKMEIKMKNHRNLTPAPSLGARLCRRPAAAPRKNDMRHLVSAVWELTELLRLAFSIAALRRMRQVAPKNQSPPIHSLKTRRNLRIPILSKPFQPVQGGGLPPFIGIYPGKSG